MQRYCVDSRQIRPGDCFVALIGQRVDGHAYLEQAAAQGASLAWVHPSYAGPNYGLPLHRVEQPVLALQQLARNKLQRAPSRVIAVTGSVGKTTTKEFLRCLLAPSFRLAVTEGNQNSQIGLPLFVLNQLQGDEEWVVLEMGMSKAGEIKQLVSVAPPEIALVTAIALAHAENFTSLREIARAKGEILSHPATKLGILTGDSADLDLLQSLGNCVKNTFSLTNTDSSWTARETFEGKVEIEGPNGDRGDLGPWPCLGSHIRHNLLGAIAVARTVEVPWDSIQQALQNLTVPERRMESVSKRGILFINDSYNAAPAAVLAALQSLPASQDGRRRIGVLGSMPELGGFSEACHREIAQAALSCLDLLYCLGDATLPMRQVWADAGRQVQFFTNKDILLHALERQLRKNDVVLVKGANMLQMWDLVDRFQSIDAKVEVRT